MLFSKERNSYIIRHPKATEVKSEMFLTQQESRSQSLVLSLPVLSARKLSYSPLKIMYGLKDFVLSEKI